MNCTEYQPDLATIVKELSNLDLFEIEIYESYLFGCNTIKSSLVKKDLRNFRESNDPKENELSIKKLH